MSEENTNTMTEAWNKAEEDLKPPTYTLEGRARYNKYVRALARKDPLKNATPIEKWMSINFPEGIVQLKKK